MSHPNRVNNGGVKRSLSSKPSVTAIKSGPAASEVQSESLQTAGQLMRKVSQDLQRLYGTLFNHSPKKVTCHLIADKLLVWMEGSISSIEKIVRDHESDSIQGVRAAIDQKIHAHITQIVENALQVKVVVVMTDTSYEQECTGWIVQLSEAPEVRMPNPSGNIRRRH